jgi:hypothetical protein
VLNQILNALAFSSDFNPFDPIDPSTGYLLEALRTSADQRVSDYLTETNEVGSFAGR